METRVPADDGAWRPPSGPAGGDAVADAIPDAVEHRLAAIEARLAALESSLDDVVAQGLRASGEEMRRAVSDLGRLLLRDLDRLTKVLAEHRDMIVERLSPEAAASDPAEPAPAEAGDATSDETGEDEPASRLTGEQGRWKAFAPRRRGRRGR